MWNQILGAADACKNFKEKPLWYAHYDFKPNFDDWESNEFGRWDNPALKQFTYKESRCGVKFDLSYF